jgi:hypothetical protein
MLIDALPAAAAHVERINPARRRAPSTASGELVANDEVWLSVARLQLMRASQGRYSARSIKP